MTLDDCYRLLEIAPDATDDELRRAHRDLTKVWHPDRFGHDEALRARAEAKLKAINEAYETISAERRGSWRRRPSPEQSQPPADPEALARLRIHRARNRAIACAAFALFLLLRRPTPGGLAIAAVLFALAFVFAMQMKMR